MIKLTFLYLFIAHTFFCFEFEWKIITYFEEGMKLLKLSFWAIKSSVSEGGCKYSDI